MPRPVSSLVVALLLASLPWLSSAASAQTPQPFPRTPGLPAPRTPVYPSPQTPQPPPARPAPAKPAMPVEGEPEIPTEATLGMPIYPNAQYLGSYDAGRGQRFYLFGVVASFAEMVTYYRTTLKQRGEVLFETPGTHTFEVGRFREETMAFPAGVTVKDYTWGGSPGLPNPKGTQPSHFPTILQIVPVPAPAR